MTSIATTVNNRLQIDFQKAKELVLRSHHALLISHEYTDGDDLGSILALGAALEYLGIKTSKVAKGGVPDSLLFLPGHSEVKDELPEDFESIHDLLITLGCANLERTGLAEIAKWQGLILNIDHHTDTKMFGTVNVWDETMAANCELVYAMLKNWRLEIDKSMALNLLTGIFTDTGGFRHANVKARTLEVAADLLRKGAKIDLISRFTFSQKDLPQLRLWAIALENARFDEVKKIIYTVVTEEDVAKAQAQEDDLGGMVELLNTIPEAKFSMLLKQRGEDIKGSLRSEPQKGVDVSEIARSLGGGGHKLAAGFKFKGKIIKTDTGWKIT